MARGPRFLTENTGSVLTEVTVRTIGARALLVPSPNSRTFNEIVVGVLGRALEVSPLDLCSCVFTANHFHLLAAVHEQQQLSRFMGHLACNLSKEVGRLRHWSGPMWSRRYDSILVSDEPDAQWNRLRYLLSHGVKEGLVESPFGWPGVHSARALVHGETLRGYWFNRTKEWAARNRGEDFEHYDYATRYQVALAPLPAFRHLSPEEYRQKVADLVREIEEQGRRDRDGRPVAGVKKILSQNPYRRPTRKTKRSPKPRFHVSSREAREELWDELRDFIVRYREAADNLKARSPLGVAKRFPSGCYPPALPFTGDPPPRRPPAPPTRRIEVLGSGAVLRGDVPEVMVPAVVVVPAERALHFQPPIRGQPRARGQPH